MPNRLVSPRLLASSLPSSVVKMWTKPGLSRIVGCAKTYDIEIEQLETKVENGFKLEYLNEYKFKKGISLWKWLLAILRKLR